MNWMIERVTPWALETAIDHMIGAHGMTPQSSQSRLVGFLVFSVVNATALGR